jgi:hypothetical protein
MTFLLGNGLRVETTGNIQLTNVSITESIGDGAVLDNTSGAGPVYGSISVTGSMFTDNTWTGLDARSHGNITLTDVVATGQEDGAYLDASGGSGSVTVGGTTFGDSDFSDNTLAGLTAKAAEGGVSITNVTADANSDGSGLATISINPPVLVGASPADHAAITRTGCKLRAFVLDYSPLPAADASEFIAGFSVTFREAP